MISFIIPTRNRPEALRRTLGMIELCCERIACDAEIIVIDNASDEPVALAPGARSRLRVRLIRSNENIGAAARNIGARQASHDWIVMLDDDSFPLDSDFVQALREAPDDVVAIGAEIVLPDGSRERGGLPEVIIGCGAAIRREAFLAVGGYDPAFDYYAEEYDLCAKFILNGWRIVQDFRFRVRHEKLTQGRDFDRIVHRLVRNNSWVMQRYAPPWERDRELGQITARYAVIAVKESAAVGFSRGMDDLLQTLHAQPATPMSKSQWHRFTGFTHVGSHLKQQRAVLGQAVAIVDAGKNEQVVRSAASELGINIVEDEHEADALIIGTISPGPMLDGLKRRKGSSVPVICPWLPQHALQIAASAA